MRGISSGGLSSHPSSSVPLSSGTATPDNVAHGSLPSVSQMGKRDIVEAEDRLRNTCSVQPLASPLRNRMILPQGVKVNDTTASVNFGNPNDAAGLPGRAFSPSPGSSMQWMPGGSVQNQNELVQYSLFPLSLAIHQYML